MSKLHRSRCMGCPKPASFNGGFWGVVPGACEAWATRLPDVYTDDDWIEPFRDPISTAPGRTRLRCNVYHSTDSVRLPDIIEGGRRWRTIGCAASAYANGSGMKPLKPSVVWFQLHFAPVDDLGTLTPRAGFAVVKVTDTSAAAQETDGENHEATLLAHWMLNEDDHWDSASKLAHYISAPAETQNRTVVGPEYFCFESRTRAPGANNTITYWGYDQVEPTVKTWVNPEVTTAEITDWPVAIFCKQSFPMGIANNVTIESTWGDGSIQSARRLARLGNINLATMKLVTSDIETNFGEGLVPGNLGPIGLLGSTSFSRTSVDAPAGTLRMLDTYYHDFASQLRYRRPIDNPSNPSEPIYLFKYDEVYGIESDPRVGSSWGFGGSVCYNQRLDPGHPGNLGETDITLVFEEPVPDFVTWGGGHAGEYGRFEHATPGADPWDPRSDESTGKTFTRAYAPGHNTYGLIQAHSGNTEDIVSLSNAIGLAPLALGGGGAPDQGVANYQLCVTHFERWNGDTSHVADDILAATGLPLLIEEGPTPSGDYLEGDAWNQEAYENDLGAGVDDVGTAVETIHTGATQWRPVYLNATPRRPAPRPHGWYINPAGTRIYGAGLAYDQSRDDLH